MLSDALSIFLSMFFLICPDVDRFDVVAVTKMVKQWLNATRMGRERDTQVGTAHVDWLLGSARRWSAALSLIRSLRTPVVPQARRK